jgi:hypothetical protein
MRQGRKQYIGCASREHVGFGYGCPLRKNAQIFVFYIETGFLQFEELGSFKLTLKKTAIVEHKSARRIYLKEQRFYQNSLSV